MEHPHIEPEHSRMPGAEHPIQMLKADHRELEQFFVELEKGSDRVKNRVYTELETELQNHLKLEGELFYPTIKGKIKDSSHADERIKEHNEVQKMLAETTKMKPSDQEWTTKVMAIKKAFQHHVKEEEEKLFPEVQKAMKPDQLSQLGQKMLVRKQEMVRK
jgi:hemerythrin superfamily protein